MIPTTEACVNHHADEIRGEGEIIVTARSGMKLTLEGYGWDETGNRLWRQVGARF